MIERTSEGGIEIIRLSHGKANVLDLELVTQIEAVFAEIGRSDAKAVVLTGRGSIFSAGVDLIRLLEEDPSYTARFVPALDSMFRRVFEFPKPLVTAINGHAIAGGCLLAISGDTRIMSEGKGRIGVPELLVGVPFPTYALEMLQLTLQGRTLEEFVYSGTTVSAERARDVGLVDRVTLQDVLEAEAIQEAVRLSALAPAAFAGAKLQLRGRASRGVDAMGSEPDREVIESWTSEEARSRIRDYLDRTIRK